MHILLGNLTHWVIHEKIYKAKLVVGSKVYTNIIGLVLQESGFEVSLVKKEDLDTMFIHAC
jgi:hypothetical protein